MSDMFIPKKEKIKIILEAVIYIVLVIAASYFTIFGDTFIRMVPMLYFLGIFGNIMFNKPIVTVILTCISIVTFGYITEECINMNVIMFVIYSGFMISFGGITGYILNVLYENFKLRRFIKYYNKIAYVIALIAVVLIPLFLNNLVNSNMIVYLIAKGRVDKYVRENYAYTDYHIKKVSYIPSYDLGMFEFDTIIDGIDVKLNYTLDKQIADVNMNKRKDNLNKIANAELNMLLKKNKLEFLNVEAKYDYSKIATNPDSINIIVTNVNENQIDNIVSFVMALKKWNKFEKIERLNIVINGITVVINKVDLNSKNIDESYILNGMKYEMLDNKEDM